MPEIKRFRGFKLVMFFHDENPPHVHIVGKEFAARLRIADGAVIAGNCPGRALREAQHWIERERRSLLARWQEFQK
jgi:Domain of unknown function (DUF4160)